MKKIILILGILSMFLIVIYFQKLELFAVNVQKYEAKNKSDSIVSAVLRGLSFSASLFPRQKLLSEKEVSTYFYNSFANEEFEIDYSKTLVVFTLAELQSAINEALPGRIIVVAPGNYEITTKALKVQSSGRLHEKIRIVAEVLGTVNFIVSRAVGFEITGSNISIENFSFEGDCNFDASCEHALHIFGDADGIGIKNNNFVNFNAHIKINGHLKSAIPGYPDYGEIKNNRLYNTRVRDTSNPITPIDLVGGSQWVIDSNFIADFAKGKGDKISYGSFLKGGGRDSKVANNTFVCQWKLKHQGIKDTRVGFSIGGGGTEERFAREGLCQAEYCATEVANNIIANCINDVGIYVNKGIGINLLNNTLKATLGIQYNNIKPKVNQD